MTASMVSPSASAERGARVGRWVDQLFAWFVAAYGAKLAQQWQGTDLATIKAVWSAELADLSDAELMAGKEACRTKAWPPTLPEFRALCRADQPPAALLANAVVCMARRRNGEPEHWPSNRLFWAAQRLGGDLLAVSADKLAFRWGVAWREAEADADKPIPLASDAMALPAPGKTTIPQAEAQKRISGLVGTLTKANRQFRQWAYDIAAKPKDFPASSRIRAAAALADWGEDVSRWPELAV